MIKEINNMANGMVALKEHAQIKPQTLTVDTITDDTTIEELIEAGLLKKHPKEMIARAKYEHEHGLSIPLGDL